MFNRIDQKPFFPPSSTYEQFVLCSNCDNEIISRYESYYARNIFHGTDFIKRVFEEKNKINHFEYNDLSYDLTNIFFLTLLWRANLSNRQGFKDVNLSLDIAESIRKQILSGKYDENTIRISAVKLDENSDFKRSVTPFIKIENSYSIILRDLIVFFHLEYDEMYSFTKNHGIDKNGKWVLPEIPKLMEGDFLLSYINPKINIKT
jgi:hypothetical protein